MLIYDNFSFDFILEQLFSVSLVLQQLFLMKYLSHCKKYHYSNLPFVKHISNSTSDQSSRHNTIYNMQSNVSNSLKSSLLIINSAQLLIYIALHA